MIIPNNLLVRLFIKERYLPIEISIPKPILYVSYIFYPLHLIGLIVKMFAKAVLYFLRYIGVGTKYFFYYVGVGVNYFFYGIGLFVKGFVRIIVYILHYIGMGVKYLFYGIGLFVQKSAKGIAYGLHYIGVGTKYFFYYVGVGVENTGNSLRSGGEGLYSGLESLGSYIKKWGNWILILLVAVTLFITTPINLLEKIFYTAAFLTLGFITYLLRDELGFVGSNLRNIVNFVNTRKGLYFTIPLMIFIISELLLVNSVENIILFYSFCSIFFLVFATMSEEEINRNYWGLLILPVILRMINLSLPFPIINSKLQLFITYGIITYSSFMMAKYLGIEMPYLRGTKWYQYIIAIFLGLGLGTLEYYILGFVPIITVLTEFDMIYLIFTIFIIGFGEEIVYRGLVQTSQEIVFGEKAALFLTSVLFGIMHLIWRNPLEFLFTTFAGFIFGYQFYKTKSIWPPTIAHIMNNTTWLIVAPGWIF